MQFTSTRPPGCPASPLLTRNCWGTAETGDRYLHSDELRHRPPPQGLSHEQWWLAENLSRGPTLLPLQANDGGAFWLSPSPVLLQGLDEIDRHAGASVVAPEAVTTGSTRDRYLLSSLMEEAITSFQMEGAATTRDVAKAMILSTFLTMQRIRELRDQPLTPQLVLDLHRLVSGNTLDDPADAGRLRPPGKEWWWMTPTERCSMGRPGRCAATTAGEAMPLCERRDPEGVHPLDDAPEATAHVPPCCPCRGRSPQVHAQGEERRIGPAVAPARQQIRVVTSDEGDQG